MADPRSQGAGSERLLGTCTIPEHLCLAARIVKLESEFEAVDIDMPASRDLLVRSVAEYLILWRERQKKRSALLAATRSISPPPNERDATERRLHAQQPLIAEPKSNRDL